MYKLRYLREPYRQNMELDLQIIVWDPATPPPPHLGSYTKALLVSQDRRHLFVTPLSWSLSVKSLPHLPRPDWGGEGGSVLTSWQASQAEWRVEGRWHDIQDFAGSFMLLNGGHEL
jgi:hypothetical protein